MGGKDMYSLPMPSAETKGRRIHAIQRQDSTSLLWVDEIIGWLVESHPLAKQLFFAPSDAGISN